MSYLSPSLEEQTEQEARAGRPPLDTGALAVQLRAEYDEAERARGMVNLRWLEDLRQYRGMYAPEVLARLKKTKRAKVYYRMTTAKINTMTARLMDLLFPQRVKNWAIEPTPDPMLPDDVVMQEMQDEISAAAEQIMGQTMQGLQAQNTVPDMWAAQNLMAEAFQQAFQQVDTTSARVRIAKDRATAMERVIDDQLRECNANGQRRPSLQQNCRSVVKSACLYGMGVLKGPLVERVETKRFAPTKDENGNTVWSEQVFSTDLRPYHEAVSVWDIFPDPGARLPAELRYVWQVHMMTDKDLLELANFPGFNGQNVKKYIQENPDGDAQLSAWESQIRDLNEDNLGGGALLKNRYRVYERWGFLSGHELAAAGADISEEQQSNVYSSNVWLLGDNIIKAMVNPLEGVDIPYFFYPYQQDDTSFWPEGIAYQLRAPQAGINASVRAMQDNAGASSGPVYGINMAYLAPDEDPLEMQANRFFLFNKSGVNLSQAFQAVTVPSAIEHNLALANFWQQGADEVSTPRFNQGDGNIAGAGKTASGLSMLMGAANILLKDHIKDFDDCIVAPFIRAMFRWNMQWNPREDIKGDFEVVASGSQSMIAKEVRAQQVPALISYMGIQDFAPYIRAAKLLEVALEQTDLPAERILRNEEEAKQYVEQQMRAQAKAQAQAQTEALMEQLQRQGMTSEQIQQQVLLLLAQLAQAASGGQAGIPAAQPEGVAV
ncbi:hypothetical protein HMPREF1022_02918 [Desulfovibrio sp. 6_1_46AFAA]|uniref:hypothetical protein n=1 Tax=Desulfovibrio sp. 6_1_46AFAA TaxID=665942 RepID=UPI0002236D69|nr:hypothetical protein [Desulfovibrio sp. 6_1_46AFAA]EGW50096.1 hypothetical protein HMPREF1022_02918 [Desulfovibrio sp. 6_1_46AFAA]